MLRAIHIKRFGLFSEVTFALGPVTVFHGANQSGKTTLFDAIRIAAFHPERRSKENRALYARYGEEAQAVLDWEEGQPPEMGDGEYMNLFAVASGNLALNLNGDWLAAVKKNLFAGGIDPRNLIEEFRRKASDNRTFAHMRDLTRLERERDELRTALEEKTGQRDAILAEMDAQAAQQAELKGVTARLAQRQGEERELAGEEALQEQIAERNRLEAHLALLDEIGRTEATLQTRPHLAQDRTAELDAVEQAQRAAEAERFRAGGVVEGERSLLEGLRQEVAALAKELEGRQGWGKAIETLEYRLSLFRSQGFSRQLLWWILAALALLVGVALWVLAGRTGWGWGALAAGVAVSPVLAVVPRWVQERLLLAALKDRWRRALGPADREGRGAQLLACQTLDGFAAALAQAAAELERLESEHAAKVRAAQVRQANVDEAQGRLEQRGRDAEDAAEAVRTWLSRHQAESRDAYRDALAAFRRDQKSLAECYTRLEALLQAGGHPDAFHLKSEAERRLRDLDAQEVPRQGLPEEQRRALRVRLEALRAELETLQGQRHAVDRASFGSAERLAGQLAGLPEEIAERGERLRRVEAEIAALEFDRKAAVRALELFQAVAEDETTVLADLSGAVARTFGRLSGVGDAHQAAVALSSLSQDGIRALDRAGSPRPVEQLSSGAQHLLYLALRLEMARRERGGRSALLCLDEPFAFLDPDRQMETLQYLRHFMEETGWQLILFTNDPAQAERARAVFPDCRMHSLG